MCATLVPCYLTFCLPACACCAMCCFPGSAWQVALCVALLFTFSPLCLAYCAMCCSACTFSRIQGKCFLVVVYDEAQFDAEILKLVNVNLSHLTSWPYFEGHQSNETLCEWYQSSTIVQLYPTLSGIKHLTHRVVNQAVDVSQIHQCLRFSSEKFADVEIL